MTTPKRYDLVTNYRAGSSIEEMERSDDGEWVRWESVQELLAEAERAREAAQQEIDAAKKQIAGILDLPAFKPTDTLAEMIGGMELDLYVEHDAAATVGIEVRRLSAENARLKQEREELKQALWECAEGLDEDYVEAGHLKHDTLVLLAALRREREAK